MINEELNKEYCKNHVTVVNALWSALKELHVEVHGSEGPCPTLSDAIALYQAAETSDIALAIGEFLRRLDGKKQ